jgi:hypothetical protein
MCVANNIAHPPAEVGDDVLDFGMNVGGDAVVDDELDAELDAEPRNANNLLEMARLRQRRLIRRSFD